MRRILLVEPDKILGSLYSSSLRKAGHEVVWCQNAQQAISELDQDKTSLVVLELQLALHNGIEFLYELRSYSDWAALPVIILSHVPKSEFSMTLIDDCNIACYLYKPQTNLRQLNQAVDEVFVKTAA